MTDLNAFRLKFYVGLLKASALALDRTQRGCYCCGLLPEEGTKPWRGGCPQCRKVLGVIK